MSFVCFQGHHWHTFHMDRKDLRSYAARATRLSRCNQLPSKTLPSSERIILILDRHFWWQITTVRTWLFAHRPNLLAIRSIHLIPFHCLPIRYCTFSSVDELPAPYGDRLRPEWLSVLGSGRQAFCDAGSIKLRKIPHRCEAGQGQQACLVDYAVSLTFVC